MNISGRVWRRVQSRVADRDRDHGGIVRVNNLIWRCPDILDAYIQWSKNTNDLVLFHTLMIHTHFSELAYIQNENWTHNCFTFQLQAKTIVAVWAKFEYWWPN